MKPDRCICFAIACSAILVSCGVGQPSSSSGSGQFSTTEGPPLLSETTSEETSIDPFLSYEESDQEGKMLFPRGKVGKGYIGDPMPYYEDGKMYVYYLEDARNYGRGAFHPISLLKTEDYITYEEFDRVIPFENERSAVDFALGTGACIKAKDGVYHFYYTGHNSNADSGLPYVEKIQHATSSDKINWTKLDDGFYGDCNDFRDPHLVYIEEKDEYWMLVTKYKNTLGTLHRYSSKDLYHWTDEGTYYRNSEGYYNMECSTLIHHKGYWYLSFSEQGNHRVVHYRYKRNLTDDWIVPELDYLDAEGLYAGKMAGDEDHLYMYGWCGTKSWNSDTGSLGWGGNLIGHELIQKENGELGIKPIEMTKEALGTRYPHKTSEGEIREEISFGAGYGELRFEPFKENRFARMSFDYIPSGRSGYSGIFLGYEESGPKLAYRFGEVNHTISFHNNVQSVDDLGDADVEIPYEFEREKTYHMELYYDDQVCCLYVNGDIALTARAYQAKGKPFALFGKDRRCEYNHIQFYE